MGEGARAESTAYRLTGLWSQFCSSMGNEQPKCLLKNNILNQTNKKPVSIGNFYVALTLNNLSVN